jgi:elongation factor Ts
MKVDIAEVKRLKEITGVGITDAKRALEQAAGNFDQALEAMRIKGLAKADKKGAREARAGIVDTYTHANRIGVAIEVNCETDFVAKTEEFKALVHNLCLQVAASAPLYVLAADIPESVDRKERELIAQELENEGKPKAMIVEISAGKVKKWHAEVCLVDQPFIKDPDQTVGELVKEHIARLGENIVIRRFARIELGQVES